jgi:hypothetical protein
MSTAQFEKTLRALIAGEREIEHGFNEFIGHADVVRQLLEVAPDAIRDDLQFLHDLLCSARDARGGAILGVFPALCNPGLANVEGRISDYVREHCGIALGDGRYEAGTLVGESNCPGWPGAGSPLTNDRFPYLIDTSASNYFSNRFWHGENGPPGFIPVPTNGKVVFRGEYARSRYFAFHPSDFDTNNLATLVDVDLDPDEGSANPFRGPVPEGMGRRFTAQLDFGPRPDVPEPNTTYCAEKANGGPNQAVFCIFRTTGSELGAMPPNNTGVALPSITCYDAEGNQTLHYDEAHPYPPGCEYPVETTHFAPLPIPDYRGICWPGSFSTKSNWGLPYDILASADILYLVTPYTQRLGDVLVCRAKSLTAPNTPNEPVYTAGKDIRGYTITTYNFWAGICVDAVVDNEVALDDDGYFTIVVSHEQNRPTNATRENAITWLDWGDYLDGQLTFRCLLRRDPKLEMLREAIDTGEALPEIAGYVPRAGHCSRAAFERNGFTAAFDD